MLRVNESLYYLLEHLRGGGSIEDYTARNPVMNQENILKVLLMLVGGGYLKLEKVTALKDFPFVSIIVPARDCPDDLAECLKSLENLVYPKDKMEIIVVDDGSKQPVSQVISSSDIRVIRNEVSKGQSAGRNTGAAAAKGDVLAFLDADCAAGENWLAETVPFFRAANAGAVGGCVDGYYRRSFLDRYEKAFSPLNMGKRLIIEAKSSSGFYVPTANLLVARDAFKATGGFNETMRIGEDVDFCWRLRDLGYTLVYAPLGTVAHKHRNKLGRMLQRRADYGSSEALLYGRHRDKKKSFSVSVFSGPAFLALVLAIVLMNPYPLLAVPLFFLADLSVKSAAAARYTIPFSLRQLRSSALRSFLSFFYYAFFHVTRYYLVLFIGFGFLWYPLWILGGLGLLCASAADYLVKKPAVFYPVFLFYYTLEHLAYQVGVFLGCIERGYFGSYLLSFRGTK